jgi:hypothetical protein
MERKIETEEKAIDIRNWNLASIDLSSVSAADSAAQQRCIYMHINARHKRAAATYRVILYM